MTRYFNKEFNTFELLIVKKLTCGLTFKTCIYSWVNIIMVIQKIIYQQKWLYCFLKYFPWKLNTFSTPIVRNFENVKTSIISSFTLAIGSWCAGIKRSPVPNQRNMSPFAYFSLRHCVRDFLINPTKHCLNYSFCSSKIESTFTSTSYSRSDNYL